MALKMMIIDGSSLMHRAFYALPLLTTASGMYTNAIYGFTTMLVRLLSDVKPDRVVVAFDKSRVTFRNDMYKDYKGQRKKTPSELSEQFPLVQDVLKAFGITVLEQQGYEADDIIGTLATQARDAEVIIVTGDKDALQLINEHTTVFLTKKGITDIAVYDEAAFRAQYELEPIQMIDLKGLMGDTSDNIPGVPGVGEKTACKLLKEFGSVENLLEHIDQVSGTKLKEKLREHRELAVLSKQLATIVRDMPLEVCSEDLVLSPNAELLKQEFTRFEFKTLIAKIPSLVPGAVSQQPEEQKKLEPVITITNESSLLIEKIIATGTLYIFPLQNAKQNHQVQGFSIYLEGKGYYIPANHSDWPLWLELLQNSSLKIVTYDAKALYKLVLQHGSAISPASVFDTLIAAYLLDPINMDYSIPNLAAAYLDEHSETIGSQEDTAGWYAKLLERLYPIMQNKLQQLGLEPLFLTIEMELVKVLAVMELNGIEIDQKRLEELSDDIAVKIHDLLTAIFELSGEEFNVNSPKQLGVILFDKLKLPVMKKTKTGYSTDAEVLEKLTGMHPIIDKILEFRLLSKLKSTYLDGMKVLVSQGTSRIFTTFNQTVTATGRLSSSEPNLQNIPVRTEVGRNIRELFIPGNEYDYLMSADYSQIELRVLAHMSQDPLLMDAFKNNEDIHTRTASQVFGVAPDEVTSEMRSRAKAVNFGIIYGISDYGLSRDIGVSRQEAASYIENYFAKYTGVKAFMDQMIESAHSQGYVATMFGRRRYLPDINSRNFNKRSFAERTAMNTPIQGTAADIIKKAMIEVYHKLRKGQFKTRLLLQVHDELVLEVPKSEVQEVAALVKESMEQAVILSVPLTVDVKTGLNWANAK